MKKVLVIFLLASCLLPSTRTVSAALTPSIFAYRVTQDQVPTPPGQTESSTPPKTNQTPEAGDNEGRQTGQQSKKESQLENRIREALDKAGIKDIDVYVRNDAVSLRGNVSEDAQRARVLNIVRQIQGVNPTKINLDGLKANRTISNANNGSQVRVSGDQTSANQQQAGNNQAAGDSDDSSWSILDLFYKVLLIMAGLLLVGFIGYAIWKLIKHLRGSIDNYFWGVKKGQDELAAKFDSSINGFKKEFNLRIKELQDQIQTLSGNLTDNRREILDGIRKSSAAAVPAAYPGYAEQLAAPKVNTFPVSVDEYLNKMKSVSMVVKPDFQNEILVQDPDGRGELMLVQDHEAAPGGLYYVVPKVGYLQAKQEFFGYYEKYYDCPRLTLGEVWIVEPAVVDKVSGGWRLREKGELEIK